MSSAWFKSSFYNPVNKASIFYVIFYDKGINSVYAACFQVTAGSAAFITISSQNISGTSLVCLVFSPLPGKGFVTLLLD